MSGYFTPCLIYPTFEMLISGILVIVTVVVVGGGVFTVTDTV